MEQRSFDDLDIVVAGFPVQNGQTLLVEHEKLGRWLPPGGHIEANETPDQALKREIDEEVGLSVEIPRSHSVKPKGEVKEVLGRPFHVNVHCVGDHDHCCLFYVCFPTSTGVTLKRDEVRNAQWFSADKLETDSVPQDVEDLGKIALEESRTRAN